MRTADRLDQLERSARASEERLLRLEAAADGLRRVEVPWVPIPPLPSATPTREDATSSPRPAPPALAPAAWPPAVAAPSAAPRPPRPTLEELLGGRVLAWVGGAAVLVGLAFLFALGISSGWIGEAGRCVIAAAGCGALVAAGARLHGRAGRTQAARAAVATGLAGLFLTLTVATAGYGLLSVAAGLAAAAAVGVVAVALALSWAAPVIAALGVVGALLAPVLAGATGQDATLGFLGLAGVAAVVVAVRQRWGWVSVCVALTTTPQWLTWLADGHRAGAILLVLTAFGLLTAAAVVGEVLRDPARELGTRLGLLLATNALVLTLAGWWALRDAASRSTAVGWLVTLAAAHLALGLIARRSTRGSADLGLMALALGVVLADVAYATLTGGVVQALGWAGGAMAFAALARTGGERRGDRLAVAFGLGLHVALAVLSAAQDFDVETLFGGGAPTGAAAATLAALAAACLISARLAPRFRLALDLAGLAAAALLAAQSLDGVALTATWALQAAALCGLGVRGGGDGVAFRAGIAHLALAAAWCLADQAPPTGLLDGVGDLGAAALGVGAVLAAGARIAVLVTPARRGPLLAALAVGALLLASLGAVALGGPDDRAGQLWLSGLWALVGVGALLGGLRADVAAVRTGALALLAVTIAKVFVYDLATQGAGYRVASFLGLGLLLLAAAFAYQRLRPVTGAAENPGGREV